MGRGLQKTEIPCFFHSSPASSPLSFFSPSSRCKTYGPLVRCQDLPSKAVPTWPPLEAQNLCRQSPDSFSSGSEQPPLPPCSSWPHLCFLQELPDVKLLHILWLRDRSCANYLISLNLTFLICKMRSNSTSPRVTVSGDSVPSAQRSIWFLESSQAMSAVAAATTFTSTEAPPMALPLPLLSPF